MTDEVPRQLQPADSSSNGPSPWLAAALSFLLPGAGQALNGQFWKGTFLLCLSFVILPAVSLARVHLGSRAALTMLLPLLLPWVYSMVNAASEAARLKRAAAPFHFGKGAIFVAILLLVIFPVIALVFSLVTLLLLPREVVWQIADWVEGVERACGFRR